MTARFIRLVVVVLLCALGREAVAQLSLPYDPDFPADTQPARQPAQPGPSAAPEPSPEAAPPVPTAPAGEPALVVPKSAGPFLLRDRTEPGSIFEPQAQPPAAPADFSEFLKSLKPLEFSQDKWNRARENIESGKPAVEAPAPIPGAVSEEAPAAAAAQPAPPPPEVELPTYGTSLSVTGRKVISFQYSQKRYINEQKSNNRPMTSGMLDITQQLQLRMQGKVGPKIAVNVDYDDTKTNKQDISVVYQGDANEVVQNVSFGDIDLSLPATEFVQYNKQLFGIRADVKYKGLKASFIGSRTKGQTKFRQFHGNSQFASADILDSSYLRRQYYDVSFSSPGRLPIQGGSERVYLAQQTPGAQINLNDVELTVDDLAVAGSSFTGRFSQLVAGIDYSIDYAKGILTFRYQLQPQHVVAVDFVDSAGLHITFQSTTTTSGGTGRFKLVKTPADLPIAVSTETGYNRELKTFYSIGQNQIIRDDGRGNFVLRVLDPTTRNEVGSGLTPQQKYPDNIDVDFENGIFRLLQPFSVSNSCPTVPDPDLYAPTPVSKRLFRVEYSFRFKTFFVEPSVVPQSEIVLLDRTRLVRNVDYFIDYDAGFITFFNEDRIRPDSEISISYEVAPFLGLSNESLLGSRVSYDWKKASAGSTILYQSGIKSPSVPSITELARSLITYEFDSKLTDIKLLSWLRLASVAGEFAQSRYNPNLNDFALIDNMEGIKQETLAPALDTSWKVAANPSGVPSDPTRLQWFTEDVKTLFINPRSEAGAEETQKVLGFKYDFSDPGTQEVSIVFPFSVSGEDFSQKNILEVVMLGDLSGNELNFHLGGINEDADGTAVLDTEDANRDGILQETEDIGQYFAPAGKPSTRFGDKNGRIDTEDLNQNGRLDSQDLTGDDFGYLGNIALNNDKLHNATDSTDHTVIDFGSDKWRTFQIPLNISSATASRWTAVKQVRISIRKKAAGAACLGMSCAIKFARVAVVGNSWLRGQPGDPSNGQGQTAAGETLTATPANSVDNPDYVPIYNGAGQTAEAFKDLYGDLSTLQKQTGSRNLSEQALQLEFVNMGAGAVVTTKRVFGRAVDISQHKHFNFLVYGNADPNNVNETGNKIFFLRVGNDTNFFEARVPITFTGWRKIQLLQADVNGDMIGDEWRATVPDVVIITSGTPSLQQVAQVVAGVRSTAAAPGPTRGRLYLNEIYLSEPVTRVGTAKKFELNLEVAGWASFGAKHWSRDRNFQTPTSVVTNQNRREDSTYLNFNRLRWFPMNFSVTRAISETPSTVKTGDLSNTVNLLQQGKVTAWNGTASGNFSLGAWPRVSLGHTRVRTEYDLLTRADDRRTYNASLTYGVPLDWRVLPKTVDASYSLSHYDVTFESPQARLRPGNSNTEEASQTYIGRMSFTPWQGSGLNPNYSLTRVNEKRSDLLASGAEIAKAYQKSLTQNAGFNSNWRLNRWLNPQVNYSVDIIENNNLAVSTYIVFGSTFVFDVGDVKTVNRNANGSVNLPITIGEIFQGSKFFRSFNIASSYQVQDGDVWNGVEKGLRSQFGLWVRESLKPRNPAASRANQTLRDTINSSQRWNPLEAYGITGRPSAFKTIALSNNYAKTIERTDVTGTVSKRISTTLPDMVASIGELEKLMFTDRWMNSTQMNYKYSFRKTETVATSLEDEESFGTDLRTIILKKFDSLVNYNFRVSEKKDLRIHETVQRVSHEDATVQVTFDVKKFRFTPKFDYTNDVTKLGTGLKTQDLTTLTPSMLVRADLALPKGLKLPGAAKPLLFTNRIIWTTTMSMQQKTSPITIADNSRLFTLNTSGDYEIAKNLRMTMNGALSRLWHKYLKEDEYISYQLGSTLTFQF